MRGLGVVWELGAEMLTLLNAFRREGRIADIDMGMVAGQLMVAFGVTNKMNYRGAHGAKSLRLLRSK